MKQNPFILEDYEGNVLTFQSKHDNLTYIFSDNIKLYEDYRFDIKNIDHQHGLYHTKIPLLHQTDFNKNGFIILYETNDPDWEGMYNSFSIYSKDKKYITGNQ